MLNCAEAPDEYDAIYFHDDDLEDAGWQQSFEWRIPDDIAEWHLRGRLGG